MACIREVQRGASLVASGGYANRYESCVCDYMEIDGVFYKSKQALSDAGSEPKHLGWERQIAATHRVWQ